MPFNPILTLIMALFAYLGPIEITSVQGGIAWDGKPAAAFGTTTCTDEGKVSIRIEAGATPYQLAHELLHAAACKYGWDTRHDYSMDAKGLDPSGCTRIPGDCPHSFVAWALTRPDGDHAALDLINGLPR